MPGTDVTIVGPGADQRPAAAGAEVDRLAAAAAAYADAATAASTRRAYETSWRAFVTWCDARQAEALPAHPLTVAFYLTDHAGRLAIATLSRQLAAIRTRHRLAGHPPPASAELERVWRGIRREHGRPSNAKRALVIADLRKICARLPATLAGARDRALLLVCFAGALRRSELVALVIDDGRSAAPGAARLRLVAAGAEIRLGRSKTDQEGEGQFVAIPRGRTKLCPITALTAWLQAAGISSGAVFRSVDRHGRVGRVALSDRAVAVIVKRAAESVGLDPAVFGAHSLRAGLATTAGAAGVDLQLVMRQLRHTKAETTMRYIREGEVFRHNAAGKVGL